MMSSDVMIVCKEFENSSNFLWSRKDYTPKHPAVFIDEASMGDPWNEFGKWFVQKFYNGNSMIETMLLSRTQEDIDKNSAEIHDNPLKEFDYKTISKAIDTMKCHENMDKEKVRDYLIECVGNSISTENW